MRLLSYKTVSISDHWGILAQVLTTLSERPITGRTAATDSFLGEDSSIPATPQSRTSRPASRATSASVASDATAVNDPSAWTQAQQEQFMRALMGAGLAGTPPPELTSTTEGSPGSVGSTPLDTQDPLMALMQSFATAQGAQGTHGAAAPPPFNMPTGMTAFPGMGMPGMGMAAPPKPKTLSQKLLPMLHLLVIFAVVAYFVLYKEVGAFVSRAGATVSKGQDVGESQWRRWAELAWRPSDVGGWGVQAVVSSLNQT
jgi:hypothetical protein